TTNIPISPTDNPVGRLNHRNEGSLLDADHPAKGVLFARRSTVSLETVIAAIDKAVPSIEIVDSRIADWQITFADTVADNGSSAFFVLGTTPLPHAELDLYSCGMVTEVNGSVASVGSGAACLGHPYNSVHWIARMLAKLGEPLRAGDILLSGALGPMVTLAPGDHVRIHIGGIGSCAFTYGSEP
ncbi:2-keto-4-pentenoate hydratase, partial [Sphingomonas sp. SRS2]|uniref:2-keto-4-pentenoate hydratase n=1 Tax=Sphingomonas sp. SRS2 TaxID=133190 RepID=UPI000AB299DE